MKKIIALIVVFALPLAMVSCQKEADPKEEGMSIEEQYAYMDATGDKALSQIDPADFQKLADLVNNFTKDSLDIEFDQASQLRLANLLLNLTKLKGLVVDFDKISGTITLDGNNATYETGTGKKIIVETDNNTYTCTFDVTSGTKEVKLGNFEVLKSKVDVYLIVPTTATAKVSDNSGLYMGGTAKNIDCSAMPSDWSSLTLDQLNASFSGEGFINGQGSYKAVANKMSIGGGKAQFDGTLYGKSGSFLASGNGSVKYTVEDEWDFDIDTTSIVFYGNILDRIISKNNASGNADVYLSGSSTPQFTVNSSTGEVTFADGTRKEFNEVFNETNLPKTYLGAMTLIAEFAKMFNIELQ